MNFKQPDITRFLQNPDPKIRCVVIFGTNEGMIADLTKQFAQTACEDLNDAFRAVWLNMEAISKDAGVLYGEYNAQSLLGGRRVVIVKDGDNNLTPILKTLFKDNLSDTLLVINSTSLNTKSSLVSLAKDNEEYALISCYDDRDENIYTFVKGYLINNGITISADAMQLLCGRLSADRKISTGELDKLITYLDTRRNIELEDVRHAISDASGSSTEDLCYFVADGAIGKALDAYRELLNEGGEPVSLVRTISYHFMRLLDYAAQVEKGRSAREVVDAIRPPVMFYRKDSLVRQVNLWKKNTVLDVLDLLYRAEKDCKTTNLPAEEILSYTLMQIGGAARKLRH